ncbi:MAG: class I SAM-dependent methyltransferase [bacterium]
MPAGVNNEYNRVKWLKKTLSQIPQGLRILDAGAGEQQFKKLCSHLDYVAQDFAQYEGKGDGKGLQTGNWDQSALDIICDITNIHEPDESFDAIMCIEVLEHLPEPIKAIKEFSRLLKPDGLLIITSPFCSLSHFSPYHFYSGFNRYFYETHLTTYGFQILELEANGNFFEYMGQELRRIKSVSEKNAQDTPHLIERCAIRIVLKMLERFSNKDIGSDELLCFGYHVLARKGV